MTDEVSWPVLEDAQAVARETARRILLAADRALAERRSFRIVLAGGNSPAKAYALLAETSADWSRWQIYFGDERCLSPGDPQRNSVLATDAWLRHVPIPESNIHAIPAERGPEAAAEAYQPHVQAALPFDLVLLGMGEDGHTASLFPGHRYPEGTLVVAVHGAPKPPPERVSLSFHALSSAREVLILVTGNSKRDPIERWRAGEELPISRVSGQSGVDVLLDRKAAGISLARSS